MELDPLKTRDFLGQSVRWAVLLGIAMAMVWCWLVFLPAVGRTPVMRRMIDRNEAAGIDVGAKFYTDLGDVQGRRLEESDGQKVLSRYWVNEQPITKD